MKLAALIALTTALWLAVIDAGIDAIGDEVAARNTMDNCLAAGNSPAYCLEVRP